MHLALDLRAFHPNPDDFRSIYLLATSSSGIILELQRGAKERQNIKKISFYQMKEPKRYQLQFRRS
jgi:hypothetical protein